MDADAVIAEVAARLRDVPGIAAVVLGGSRAAGTHRPTSDIDIGIYYRDEASFDLGRLGEVATALDDEHRADVVTPIGGWGPWVIGGGWLTIRGIAVDFIYRDLGRVAHWVDEAVAGRFEAHYQWGHPHGFLTTIYVAEVAHCRVLWEVDGVISQLKSQITPYPPALHAEVIRICGGEARFTAFVARHGLPRHDVSYTAGCIFRSVASLMQALCAANDRWLMNEKGAVATAASLARTVPDMEARVAAIYAALAPDEASLTHAVDLLDALVQDVATVVGGF
jgi:predicted nucleotidyltransferase